MKDISCEFMGIPLKNPVIAASSGLTGTLDGLRSLEKHGVSAVVLKSIFEEEILLGLRQNKDDDGNVSALHEALSETLEYIDAHTREDNLSQYLDLIEQAKKNLSIPVIGSINCVSPEDWVYYTQKMEQAGADGLELNLLLDPADFLNKEFEKAYFQIIQNVLEVVSIPVGIKISRYFTRLGLSIKALSESGISGITLFNRFYIPDIDIDSLSLGKGKMFTTQEELPETLRWIAIMSERVDCDLAASTGIHDGDGLIKSILAGADAVQVASTLYRNGPDQVQRMLKRLEQWMKEQGFEEIDEFRGRISREYQENPAAFERMQFMKHLGDIG